MRLNEVERSKVIAEVRCSSALEGQRGTEFAYGLQELWVSGEIGWDEWHRGVVEFHDRSAG